MTKGLVTSVIRIRSIKYNETAETRTHHRRKFLFRTKSDFTPICNKDYKIACGYHIEIWLIHVAGLSSIWKWIKTKRSVQSAFTFVVIIKNNKRRIKFTQNSTLKELVHFFCFCHRIFSSWLHLFEFRAIFCLAHGKTSGRCEVETSATNLAR